MEGGIPSPSGAIRRDPRTGRLLPGTSRIPPRGVSRPYGNVNAVRTPQARAAIFWRRRALRKDDRWVLTFVEDYRVALLADRPDASAAEMRTVELAAIARGCVMLILAASAKVQPGGLTGDVVTVQAPATNAPATTVRRHRQDFLGALAKYMAVELGALKILGLERRAKQVPSLQELLRG